MLLLAIYGSPRKNGNTDLMLNAFTEGAAETGANVESLYVRDLRISGCVECGGCDETGECVVRDDMDLVYPLLDRADAVVVASPVFFYGVPGQLKLLIDRTQACYMRREIQKVNGNRPASRPGFLLSAGATRGKRLFECPALTVKNFYDALGIEYTGELVFREIDDKGAILRSPGTLDQCRTAGKEFVEKMKRAGD